MDHGVKLLVPKGQHLQTGSTGSQNHQASMVHAQLDVGIWKVGFCKAPIFIQEMPARAYANDFHTRAVISSARKHVCTLCFWILLEHPVPTFGNQITQWQTTLDACFLDISEEPEIKSDLGRPGIQLWTMGVLCQTCRKNVTNDPRWPKMTQDDPRWSKRLPSSEKKIPDMNCTMSLGCISIVKSSNIQQRATFEHKNPSNAFTATDLQLSPSGLFALRWHRGFDAAPAFWT